LLIGSDPACAVHIDSLALAPKHACIELRDNDAFIRDLDTSQGTFLNGTRLTEEQPLKDGDTIGIGKHVLTFSSGDAAQEMESAPAAATADEAQPAVEAEAVKGAPTAWLQILNGQNLGKTISLARKLTNLGKPGVQTAVIARRGSGYFLSHLEGESTPLVSGEEIGEHIRELRDGDVIQMGNVKMQFFYQ